MKTREIARAYGMPVSVAALISKDPSQIKYWQKCGEEFYNGCLKWVDSRENCPECRLCQQCCRARGSCTKDPPEASELLVVLTAAQSHSSVEETTPPLPEEEEMPIPGKMEITIKISEFPADVKTVANGWKEFVVDAGGREISITIKPKSFAKLEQAQRDFPAWVAAITGKMGRATERGFILDEPGLQVFEKKPKAEAAPAVAATA